MTDRCTTPLQSGRRVNRQALYNALMRACFKAESLDRKLVSIGITTSGLGQAAREFRWAAEQVEAQKGKR